MEEIGRRLKFYLESTSLHGLRYSVDASKHFLIRILWIVVFFVSGFFMVIIFRASYNSFQYNSISFLTETTYLDWDTNFPAITFCETTSAEVFWTPEPGEDYSPVQQFISDIIFFTGSCYSCSTECEECERFDFRQISIKYRKRCDQLLKTCKWNNKEFDCCKKFLPLDSEYGFCFSINSMHTNKTHGSHLNMKSNRKTGPGQLYVEAMDDVRMYFHAPEDVPFINSNSEQRKDIALGEEYNVTFNIIEINNDEGVQEVPTERRGCRFPWEKSENLRVHDFYSYSTCIVQCHADAHFKMCNCTHHLMPGLSEQGFCDMEGLQCLTDNFEVLNRLHAEGFNKPGLVCNCIPSCLEPEYNIVLEQRGINPGNTEIFVKMQSLPTFRFKRNVVRSTMDFVVSIGGSAGLFIGASLLSIIETPYLLLFRR